MAAEEEGCRRTAVTACVDTLSTQAPGFYPKLGYVEFGRNGGRAEGRPVDRIWFRKEFVRRRLRGAGDGLAARQAPKSSMKDG